MEVNAFEFVRPRGAMPKPKHGSKWRIGRPPYIGWWLARNGWETPGWRWWDGRHWSLASPRSNNAHQAGALAQFEAQNSAAIAWCWDWPKFARVPRINPATGAVTGGVQ